MQATRYVTQGVQSEYMKLKLTFTNIQTHMNVHNLQ